MLLSSALSCSDPIFWTLQREKPTDKNNLPKKATALGIAEAGNSIYAAVGGRLYKKEKNNASAAWTYIATPSRVYGVAGDGTNLSIGLEDGGYAFSTATDQVGAQQESSPRPKPIGFGRFLINKDQGVFNITGDATDYRGDYRGESGSYIATSTAVYKGGVPIENKDVKNPGAIAGGYLAANDKVGEWNGTWGRTYQQPAVRALLDYSDTGGTLALVGGYMSGYTELYEKDGELSLRNPESTVGSDAAYQVSDLADATIESFAQTSDGRIFALTTDMGLWQLYPGGEWSWE